MSPTSFTPGRSAVKSRHNATTCKPETRPCRPSNPNSPRYTSRSWTSYTSPPASTARPTPPEVGAHIDREECGTSVEGLAGEPGDLLEAHWFPQHVGHDLRHVVMRQILWFEYRDAVLSAPGGIEQQRGGGGGDVAGGAGRKLAVPGDRREEHALALDRLDLVEDVVHERGHRQRPVAHARARDQVVQRQRRRHQPSFVCYPAAQGRAETPTTRLTRVLSAQQAS